MMRALFGADAVAPPPPTSELATSANARVAEAMTNRLDIRVLPKHRIATSAIP
jgi:hypothetical protein